MTRTPIAAGNWKMHGISTDLEQVQAMNNGLTDMSDYACDVIICPPATLLHRAASNPAFDRIAFGGQSCRGEQNGAFTGDQSADMVKDAGGEYVIIGHSERRAGWLETSAFVKQQAVAAQKAGLVPIICVGEPEEVRDAGEAEAYIVEQLEMSLPDSLSADSLIIAYEPVWAIGTGRTPTAEDVAAMHTAIRASLTGQMGVAADGVRILYGGSVKPANAAELMGVDGVDGALVGGASLKSEDFLGIIRAAYTSA